MPRNETDDYLLHRHHIGRDRWRVVHVTEVNLELAFEFEGEYDTIDEAKSAAEATFADRFDDHPTHYHTEVRRTIWVFEQFDDPARGWVRHAMRLDRSDDWLQTVFLWSPGGPDDWEVPA